MYELKTNTPFANTLTPMTKKCFESNDLSDMIYSSLHKKLKNQPFFGLEEKFNEFEKWIRKKSDKNYPLIFLTRKNEYQHDFLIKLISTHLQKSKKIFKNIFLPIFISHKTAETCPFYVIYNLLIKLRRIFNIKRRVDLSAEKLRLSFYYWLDLVSRKIQKIKYFDADLVIIINAAHLIRENSKNIENNLKFWIPKFFNKNFTPES